MRIRSWLGALTCVGVLLGLGVGAAHATDVSGELAGDVTWGPAGNPWVITGDVTVPDGVTLTVAAGAVVRFAANDDQNLGSARTELIVEGDLLVEGEAGNPVLFSATSLQPARGAWEGITVTGTGSVLATYATVEYAQRNFDLQAGDATLLLDHVEVREANQENIRAAVGATTDMADCAIHSGRTDGVQLADGTHGMRRVRLHGNGTYGVEVDLDDPASTWVADRLTVNRNGSYGVYVIRVDARSVVRLYDSVLTRNNRGIQVSGADPIEADHNLVWGNTTNYAGAQRAAPNDVLGNPLFVDDTAVDALIPTRWSPARGVARDGGDLGAFGFAGDATVGLAGVLDADLVLAAGQVHTVRGDLWVRDGITLTIEPGAEVRFTTTDDMAAGRDTRRVELIVDGGRLVASGAADAPITLRSAAAQPARGNWGGLVYRRGGPHTLAHLDLAHGQQMIVVEAGQRLTLTDSHLHDGNDAGLVALAGSVTTVERCQIDTQRNDGVYLEDGQHRVAWSVLHDNGRTGVRVPGAAVPDSTYDFDHLTVAYNQAGFYLNRVHQAAAFRLRDLVVFSNTSDGIGAYTNGVEVDRALVWDNGNNGSRDLISVIVAGEVIRHNPLVVDAEGRDFRLTDRSPARGEASDGGDLGARPFDGVLTRELMGTLRGDLLLTAEGSPWRVAGDLYVPPGVTLTVQPGATVLLGPGDGTASGIDRARTEIIVDGTLQTGGEPDNPVTWASANPNAGRTDWYGIRLLEPATDCVVRDVVLRDAQEPLQVATDADLSLARLRLTNYGVRGINLAGTGRYQVTGSRFTGPGGRGVHIGDRDGNNAPDPGIERVVVRESIFTDLSDYAISAMLDDPDSSVLIDHVTIHANANGIWTRRASPESSLMVRDSLITSNNSWGIYDDGQVPATLDHSNVWGNNNNSRNLRNVVFDADSLSVNPLYLDADNRDLQLTALSPVIGEASDGGDMGALPFDGDQLEALVGVLREDLTLTAEGSPWRIAGDIYVPRGITLTIEAGATVRFGPGDQAQGGVDRNRTEVIVDGSFRVLGTAANPVQLASAAGLPARSDWYGVRLLAPSTNNVMRHFRLRHSLNGAVVGTGTAMIVEHGAFDQTGNVALWANGRGAYTFRDLRVFGPAAYGVHIGDGDANNVPDAVPVQVTLERAIITGMTSYGVKAMAGHPDASVRVRHCTIDGNSSGLWTRRTDPDAVLEVRDSQVTSNSSWGVYDDGGIAADIVASNLWDNNNNNRNVRNATPDAASLSVNPLYVDRAQGDLRLTHRSASIGAASDDGDIGALPFDGALTDALLGVLREDTTLTRAGSPWRIPGDVIVPSGVTLTVEPGARVVFAPSDLAEGGEDRARVELIVHGTLVARGTPDAEPVFESENAAPGANDWSGIHLRPGSVDHVLGRMVVRHATNGLWVDTAAPLDIPWLTVQAVTHAGVLLGPEAGQVRLTDLRAAVAPGQYGVSVGDRDNNAVADLGAAPSVELIRPLITGATQYGFKVVLSDPDARMLVDHATITRNANGARFRLGLGVPMTIRGSVVAANTTWGLYSDGTAPPTTEANNVWGHNNGNRDYRAIVPDAASVSANPLFVDPDRNDYALTHRSPSRFADPAGGDQGVFPYDGAQTTLLMGWLHTDLHLDLAGSPYQLAGDLRVLPGRTLSADPGVRILASPNTDRMRTNDTARGEIEVDGALRFQGTAVAPIRLGSNAEVPAVGHWGGLIFRDGARVPVLSNVEIAWTQDGVRHESTAPLTLSDFTVRDARGNGVVVADTAGPLLLERVSIVRAASYGVDSRGADVRIESSVFWNNNIAARLRTTPPDGRLRVVNNTFHANRSEVLQIYKSSDLSEGVVANNLFTSNVSYAVRSYDSFDPVVDGNAVTGNRVFLGVNAPGNANIGLVVEDVAYVNAEQGDLHLTDASPVIDRGLEQYAPLRDRDGRPRTLPGAPDVPARPDIGAYEYDQGAPLFFALEPARIQQGATVDALLRGAVLPADLQVAFEGAPGVAVLDVQVLGDDTARVRIAVDALAPLGPRDAVGTWGEDGRTRGPALLTVISGPAVAAVVPDTITQGESVAFAVSGRSFQRGLEVLPGPGLRVSGGVAVAADGNSFTVRLVADAQAAPGLRDLTIINPDGGQVSVEGAITVESAVQPPSIAGVVPGSVERGQQGVVLTITGANFRAGVTARLSGPGFQFGDTVRVDDSTLRLTLDVAGNAPLGPRDVVVLDPDGAFDTLAGAVTVRSGLAVEGVDPDQVLRGDRGLLLTVRGQAFTDDVLFDFTPPAVGDGIVITDAVRLGATRFLLTVDVADEAIVGRYALTARRGGEVVRLDDAIAVGGAGPPRLDDVTPASLPQGISDAAVVLRGANFGPVQAIDAGPGVQLVDPIVLGTTAINVTVSVDGAAPVGPRSVRVDFADGRSVRGDGLFAITAGPRINAVAPSDVGRGALARVVEVRGSGFAPGTTVSVDGAGVVVDATQRVDDTTLRATLRVAADAPLGPRTVSVTTPAGARASLADALTVVDAPTVQAIAPDEAFAGDTARVTITVDGVRPGATVRVIGGGIDTRDPLVIGDAVQVTFDLDPGAAPGPRDVVVVHPDGGQGVLPGGFTVLPVPVALSLDPGRVQQGEPAVDFTLNGRNLLPGATVRFLGGGVEVLASQVVDADTLGFTARIAPDAPLGPQDLLIENPDGGTSLPATLLRIDPADGARLLIARPERMFFRASVDRDAPAEQIVDITHSAEPEGPWAAEADVPWITLSAADGETPAELRVGVDPALAGVADGTLNGAITITGPAGEQTVAVTLEMLPGDVLDEIEAEEDAGALVVVPRLFDVNAVAGQPTPAQALQVRSEEATDWVVVSDQPYVRINPPGGRTPTIVDVQFDTVDLAARALPYRATLTVTSAALIAEGGPERGERMVDVRIFVRDPAAPVALQVDPAAVQIAAQVDGPAPAPVPLQITTDPAADLPWTAEVVQGDWLAVTPNGATPGVAVVSADAAGLDPANSPYQGVVRVALADGAPVDVPVTLFVGEAPPTADAGPDQRVEPGRIGLDGSASVAADGVGGFAWRVVESPAPVDLADADTANPSALLRVAGTYVFELIVTDLEGRASLPDRVRVTILDLPPFADAGVGLDWRLADVGGAGFPLRADRSQDANGSALGFSWRQIDGPPAELLGDVGQAVVQARPSRAGLYSFAVTVGDGGLESEAVVHHRVHAVDDHVPGADAGDPVRVRVGEPVRLDGSRSADGDGDALRFVWRQISGEAIDLDDPLSATPGFPALRSGRYQFELTVSDDQHESAPATVWVTVDRVADRVPVADAGPDLESVTPERVDLDSSASIDPPDDPEGARLQVAWDWASARRAEVITPQDGGAGFSPVLAGVYLLDLTVFDARHQSVPDRLVVVVDEAEGNRLPRPDGVIGDAGAINAPLTLDARAVEDADGDMLTARWRQIAGPPLALDAPEGLLASATPTQPGTYRWAVSLDDGTHRGPEAIVEIAVADLPNAAPIADAGEDVEVELGGQVILDGSASLDPDGDALVEYAWRQVDGPAAVMLPAPGADPIVAFEALVPGEYTFELVVRDGRAQSAPDAVVVVVLPREVDPNDQDSDGDGISDADEADLGLDPFGGDSDGDGRPDGIELGDPDDPIDTDDDGIIDALDDDDDGDGVPSAVEGYVDVDLDGLPNARDPDDDGDGVPTIEEGQGDTDGDGVPDYRDLDDDGDGLTTAFELPRGDSDEDGTPDYLDADDDGDTVPTRFEHPRGDTDGDGIGDELDPDDDGDSVPTADEVDQGDTNEDGEPDFLDPDDDGDGVSTLIEFPRGDENGDGVPAYLDPKEPEREPIPDPDMGMVDPDMGMVDPDMGVIDPDMTLAPDMAAAPDQGADADVDATGPDFGPDAGVGAPPSDGCGCDIEGDGAPVTVWLLLAGLALTRRRRRR